MLGVTQHGIHRFAHGAAGVVTGVLLVVTAVAMFHGSEALAAAVPATSAPAPASAPAPGPAAAQASAQAPAQAPAPAAVNPTKAPGSSPLGAGSAESSTAAPVPGDSVGAADADFLAARAAFKRGDLAQLDSLATALTKHPLALYVRFWQLDSRVDTVGDDAIRSYLAQYRGTPPAGTLHVDWLKSLAKRGQWDAFAGAWPPPVEPDVELQCDEIQYRVRRDGAAALGAAGPLWFTGASTPPACGPLFDALIERGTLTLIDRRDRMRLAVAAGNLRLAHAIADAMPAGSRITAREFAGIDRDPLRAVVRGHFSLKSLASRELALYALDRAARRDAAAARTGWLRWRGRLDAADRDYGNLRVAWYAARELDPRADAWFDEVQGDPAPQGSSDWRVWRVRAALRAGDWEGVARAIAALPKGEKLLPAWRYWRARALAASGHAADARTVYASFAGDVSYYGLLAAEARGAGRTALANAATPPKSIDPAALVAFAARSDVDRMQRLERLDLQSASRREWHAALRGLDDTGLLVASEYAKRTGLYDRAIYAADRTATVFDPALRYLAPWRSEFASAAREQGLDEELLYG
ncbi:MAG: hypothetical protein ACREX6_03675, partial [Casimicrobiaceae bacterium]